MQKTPAVFQPLCTAETVMHLTHVPPLEAPVNRLPAPLLSVSFLCLAALATLAPSCPGSDSGTPKAAPNKAAPQPTAKAPPAPNPKHHPMAKPQTPPVAPERAPSASPRAPADAAATRVASALGTFFQGAPGRRMYVQVDKPMYQPGETIWIKTWDLMAATLAGSSAPHVTYQLINPRGAQVLTKRVKQDAGHATNDLEVPAAAPGGEYLVRAIAADGVQAERPVLINAYEAPRIKKKLEFVRKAYGAGDTVNATLELRRPTGEALANQAVTAVVRVDGSELPRIKLQTNAQGDAVVRFALPAKMALGDGLLSVLVEDGGVTESISRSIPIILNKVQLTFFPEGGAMVSGLPTRLYFEARNTIGKPADVEGRIVDDVGNAMAAFSTYKNGLGRVSFTPNTGRSYHAQITRPAGVTEKVPLPLANPEGCVLRTFDDLDGALAELRVSIECSQARKVVVVAMLRDRVLDAAAVNVTTGAAAVVYLRPKDPALARARGVARVTVLDQALNPLAERVVFRNRRAGMKVTVEPHKPAYAPRDQVTLTVTTADAQGHPTPAQLALSVVDDTVISLADDKNGNMLTRLLLEPEVPGTVEEPHVFFDLTNEKSALAMELLMGTRGWRRFEWQPVFNPTPPPDTSTATTGRFGGLDDVMLEGAVMEPRKGAVPPQEVPVDLLRKQAEQPKDGKKKVADLRQADPVAAKPALAPPMAQPAEAPMPEVMERDRRRKDMRNEANGKAMAKEERAMWGDDEEKPMAMAPVRVFPAPRYSGQDQSPRTDFRETIHWDPQVLTGKDGKATVTFYLSDAVTSFRVISEGVGGGLAGRNEKVLRSSLPFSMSVKLPLEVSAGDKILLPLSMSNDWDRPLAPELDFTLGDLLTLDEPQPASRNTTLAAGANHAVFLPITVTGVSGHSKVAFFAEASGLRDEFVREVAVTPLGFPQQLSAAGRLQGSVEHSFDLGKMVPGSVEASVILYPSPVSNMMGSLDGMLREPGGCFEQASSSNYPNVMILQYLQEHQLSDPQVLQRTSRYLDRGYQLLTGYESPNRGYEWFGSNPGHEALTAYGLMEFQDMKSVFPQVNDAMVARTRTWLKSRRDGKGGYQRDPKALDSFGAASAEVTNAYITYALSQAGEKDLAAELAVQRSLAATTKDAYLLALATNTLLGVPALKNMGLQAANRLAGMQEANGSWSHADHSITRSGGINLAVETSALALLALLKTAQHPGEIEKGVSWLQAQRGGFGQWSATQATILALKALTEYARANRAAPSPGVLTVMVNGKPAGTVRYQAGHSQPVAVADLGPLFVAGKNTVSISHRGALLSYSVAVNFNSTRPASSANSVVDLVTSLERPAVKMGETVRLNVTVKNRTSTGQPMTLARVGIPGGLTSQPWQLKELREKGALGFFETRPREVIIYFRDLAPNAVKTLALDLVATVPGHYTAPASSAYLYYNNEDKTWLEPLVAEITP